MRVRFGLRQWSRGIPSTPFALARPNVEDYLPDTFPIIAQRSSPA